MSLIASGTLRANEVVTRLFTSVKDRFFKVIIELHILNKVNTISLGASPPALVNLVYPLLRF